mgnify:CR=1 FL=1
MLQEVEDYYLPYKQKRKTRAGAAREKGLEPLAQTILDGTGENSVEEAAKSYIDEEAGVGTIDFFGQSFQ